MSAPLKAYEVREDSEGHCVVVFAKNGAAARREGGNDLGLSFEEVESCTRKPQFDAYAPGPVPPLVLIDSGWWFECFHCGQQVGDDMACALDDEGLDPDDFVPRETDDGQGVFCSAACEAMHDAEKRAKTAAVDALIETFEAKFPGAAIQSAYVFGPRLKQCGTGDQSSVRFTFPGGQYQGTWHFGSSNVFVAQCDREAFIEWQNGRPV